MEKLNTASEISQRAFPDMYDSGMGKTNYNMVVSGTAGAGKTGLMESVIRSVLDDSNTLRKETKE